MQLWDDLAQNRLLSVRFMVMLLPLEHLNLRISSTFLKVDQKTKKEEWKKNKDQWHKYTLEIWISPVYSGRIDLTAAHQSNLIHSRPFIMQSICNPERLLRVPFYDSFIFVHCGRFSASIWSASWDRQPLVSFECRIRGRKCKNWGSKRKRF